MTRTRLAIAVGLGTLLTIARIAPAWSAPTCQGLAATIVGTNEPETLSGTADDDVIVARGGDDVVDAKGGNDVICAGDGADTVSGRAGADRILGGPGNDTLTGHLGEDILVGNPGQDQLFGGDSGDTLSGSADDDEMHGGPGSDFVRYSASPTAVEVDLAALTATGEGNDSLSSIEGVFGSSKGDRLIGDGANNFFVAGGATTASLEAAGTTRSTGATATTPPTIRALLALSRSISKPRPRAETAVTASSVSKPSWGLISVTASPGPTAPTRYEAAPATIALSGALATTRLMVAPEQTWRTSRVRQPE